MSLSPVDEEEGEILQIGTQWELEGLSGGGSALRSGFESQPAPQDDARERPAPMRTSPVVDGEGLVAPLRHSICDPIDASRTPHVPVPLTEVLAQ